MVNRRHLLGVGAGVGVTLLAGCANQSDSGTSGDDGTTDGSSDSETSTGTFRLLISDQPVAIDDFDSLNVSFDRARVFRGEADEDEADDSTNESEETNETDPNETETNGTNETRTNETETDDSETETMDDESDDDDEEEESDDGASGFSIIDLDGATVDLTQVVGDKAIGVFEGELEAGQYSKIELYASDVEGIVDGETAEVKIPSGKLQIVKPFEIVPDEPVSFVFDINVVKKGNNGYNLLPVISESGVAGKDVDVEEVDEDDSDDADESADAGNETDADESGDSEGDMTDGSDSNSTDTGGNETDESGQ
ncbi:DUF4382 domain-containing protein [Halohasta salina]|uniref:DUF4382 domain-containing protein n=1 Tax=Halohasta salina TaxID=2961621 RepID=UPI0020A409F4|nr:DUF4382 domain-containing protein [Halohasta salina]